MSLARQIQALLHSKIPLTRALGVRVENYDGARLVLSAPRQKTIIRSGTASIAPNNTRRGVSSNLLFTDTSR